MFEVREKGTNALIGTYSTRSRANNKRDKLDQAYGCYHYYVVNLALTAQN